MNHQAMSEIVETHIESIDSILREKARRAAGGRPAPLWPRDSGSVEDAQRAIDADLQIIEYCWEMASHSYWLDATETMRPC